MAVPAAIVLALGLHCILVLIVGSCGLLNGDDDEADDVGDTAELNPELHPVVASCGVHGVDRVDFNFGGSEYICASLARFVNGGTANAFPDPPQLSPLLMLLLGFGSTIISLFLVGESPICKLRFLEFLFCIDL